MHEELDAGVSSGLGLYFLVLALMNAYYAATKQRVRTLPLFPNATMGGL